MMSTYRNITSLMAVAAMFFLLASCMKENVNMPEFSGSDENICFSGKMFEQSGATRSVMSHLTVEDEAWVVENTAVQDGTKAAPVISLSGSVGVTAIEYSGTWDEATVYPNTRMKNDQFTFDGGNLHPVTPRAWRNIAGDDKIRFFAYAPYHDETTGLSPMDGSVKGTPYIDYTVPAAAADQTDLLYANSVQNKADDYTSAFRSTVPLVFNHALTAIQFKVGFACTVKSLTLHNIVDKGRFTATSPAAWTYPVSSKANFSLSFGEGVAKTEGQFISEGENTFMMIPQTFAKADSTIKSSDAYLELVYAQDNVDHTIKAALGGTSGASWLMGHKVIYTINKEAAPEVQYIYMDLAAGDVTISSTTYSGKIYTDGNVTDVTGTHTAANKYYIYQSTGTITGSYDKDHTGYITTKAGTTCIIPTYPEVMCGGQKWSDYITNNASVKDVIENWPAAMAAAGRAGTVYRITINPDVAMCDMTIDNIYSTFMEGTNGRTKGGITFSPASANGKHVIVRMKGDNRIGAVHYHSYYNNSITFTSVKGDNLTEGSLTVADIQYEKNNNYWNAAIGGNDSQDAAKGIIINGGTLFAGTTYTDNCTAIGGGGNGYGGITINGGRVTAVASTTGTAIGGGIGYGSQGGNADVTISGGEVYAYNYHNTSNVPAAAIGGGSSLSSPGNSHTTVTITGGYVYAESAAGGVAIGGGSSATKYGGPATVNISGGTVIAKSSPDSVAKLPAGAGIGGGTGGTHAGENGGNVIMNISGNPVITTGSIGGGKTNNATGKIGYAKVTIEGSPVISGQFVMAAGSAGVPEFTMSGGTIKNSSTSDAVFTKLQPNGGALYMDDGNCTITGGTISGCYAEKGGAVYIKKSGSVTPTFTMSGGQISGNTSLYDGGAVYVLEGTVSMTGGSISSNLTLDGNGGGVCVQGGSFIMNGPEESTQIINNAAHVAANLGANGGDGGGIYVSSTTSDPQVSIIRGTVTGNAADKNGGGMGVNMTDAGTHKATIVIGDETLATGTKTSPYVAANSAALSGGGLYVEGVGSNVWIWSGTTKGNVSAYVTNEDIRNDGGLLYLTDKDDYVDVKHVTITFHANNGSDPETTAVQRVVTNTNSLLTPPDAAKAFTRKYYTFSGWNTKRDGTGVHYSIDGKLTGESVQATMNISSDLSLYAEWVAN